MKHDHTETIGNDQKSAST
ncbi:TPA: hypothetical protein ACNTSW_004885 [Escherichia coli]